MVLEISHQNPCLLLQSLLLQNLTHPLPLIPIFPLLSRLQLPPLHTVHHLHLGDLRGKELTLYGFFLMHQKAKCSSITDFSPSINCYSLSLHSLSTYPKDYVSFLAHMFSLQEPSCYAQAKQDSGWVAAMEKELSALEKNQTWELVQLPKGQKAIHSKWVYKVKFNPDGSVEGLKGAWLSRDIIKWRALITNTHSVLLLNWPL